MYQLTCPVMETAAFLIGADKGAYFGCGEWNTQGDDNKAFRWYPVYDKPLGVPVSPAKYDKATGIWSRQFAFNTSTNKGSIQWGTGGSH